jgi:membrane-associated phospholipid phosphatase
VRVFEWISLAYFATLGIAALLRPLPAGSRVFVTGAAASMCAIIVLGARFTADGVRSALPLGLILIGYFLSARFAVRPSLPFEQWLLSWDRRWFGDPATLFARWPHAVMAFLEIAYMGCFLLVPAGLAGLLLAAEPQPLIDRYWGLVVASEFGSFVSLAFVFARPPWVLEQRAALPDRAVHRTATLFVERLTIRANTFPSGHAAGSLAVALGTIDPLPVLGLAMLILVVAICVAAVVGRYHYAADVVAGICLALAAWAVLPTL